MGALDYAFFVWSTAFLSIAAAATLFESWPLLFAALTTWLFRKGIRYRRLDFTAIAAFLLALTGYAVVVMSGDGFMGTQTFSLGSNTLKGLGLVGIATVLATLKSFSVRWSAGLDIRYGRTESKDNDRLRIETLGVIAISLAANLLASVVALCVSLMNGGLASQMASMSPIYPLLGGLLLAAPANVLWRQAHLMTSDMSINCLRYFIPLLSLGWLQIFVRGSLRGTNLGALILGVVAIGVAGLVVVRRVRPPDQPASAMP